MITRRYFLPLIYITGLSFSLLFNSCSEGDNFELNRVTFRVITKPDSEYVYITGNQPDLGDWEPGKIKLAKESDTSWINKFYFKTGEEVQYKFTRGDWQSEALDSLGNIPDNSVLKVKSDTVITVNIQNWANTKLEGRIFISRHLILDNSSPIIFGKDYRYHSGDNPDWKFTRYDDSDWPLINPGLIEKYDDWKGIGWFRINLYIDSTLWGKPTAITVSHLGASEVYFNSKLLFSTGTVGKDSSEFHPEQRRIWESLIWADSSYQSIVVRYANYNWREHSEKGFSPGFELRLREINSTLVSTYNDVRSVTNYQILFTVIPLTLGFLHLFIFIFYPYERQNLYYSLCLFSFAVLSFSINERIVSTDVDSIIYYYSMVPVSITLALLFGLYTTYAGTGKKFPKQHYLFLLLAAVISAVSIWKPFQDLFIIIYSFIALCVFEMVRTIIKSRERSQSSVFIITGFLFLSLSVVYQFLIDLGYAPAPGGFNLVYGYGVLALIFCMSMALSYNFARINKNLIEQLGQVEVLSRINLEREITAKKIEIERTLLEADNKRKTDELEEARKLQLSFLPKTIPQVKGYEIAVFMKTATEVGGDYYDFHTSDAGLTAVIGDATGHGARAGTMVSAVKGLFNVLADEPEPLSMIKKYTNALKSMNLHNLYMSFSIAKLRDGNLLYSNAGMPPVLIYRCIENRVEDIIQKTMPLGSFLDFPYTQERINLEPGDTVLFLSDGFTEAFSPEGDILGLQRAKEIFHSCADKSVEEIIECLRLEIELWQGNNPPKDDMTFVVMKKTEI